VYKTNLTADAKATLEHGDGDGTVNLISLEACKKWEAEMSGKHKFAYHWFNNTDHLEILRNDLPAEYVKELIRDLNEELTRAEPVISILP
jgi:hypothetical protein